MKVEEKNESDLKQDQSNNPQSKKDTDVVIEKDKIQDGKKNITPYWRTLKSDGKINLKYPGGIPFQKKKLINEKHKITKRGKNHFVENFENKLVKL